MTCEQMSPLLHIPAVGELLVNEIIEPFLAEFPSHAC